MKSKIDLDRTPIRSTFFIESSTAITTLAFNFVLLAKCSDLHVTAFSIIMNVGLVVLFVIAGIGQACQPIISYNHGAMKRESKRNPVSWRALCDCGRIFGISSVIPVC